MWLPILIFVVLADSALAGDGFVKKSLLRRRSPGCNRLQVGGVYEAPIEVNQWGFQYYVNYTVGTPPQQIEFLVDTASSDTWASSHFYNYAESLTLKTNHDKFEIGYSAGDFKGFWINETIGAEGQFEVSDFKMAVVTNISTLNSNDHVGPQGILGLGYKNLEADFPLVYNNFLPRLVEEGVIESPSFSLYFDNHDTGALILGGVDVAKYTGKLHKIKIIPDPQDGYRYFQTKLESLSMGDEAVDSSGQPYVWDVGTFTLTLEKPLFDKIGATFNLTLYKDPVNGDAWSYKCGSINLSQKIAFNFGSKELVYTLGDFEMSLKEWTSQGFLDLSPWDVTNATTCVFGAGWSHEGGLLGGAFMNKVYQVYDLEHNTISVAEYMPSSLSQIEPIYAQ